MRWAIGLTTLALILFLGIAPGKPGADGRDQVLASFDRELNREATPRGDIRRDSIDKDELYKTVNAVHWSQGNETISGATNNAGKQK